LHWANWLEPAPYYFEIVRHDPFQELVGQTADRLALADVGVAQPTAHDAADMGAGLDQGDRSPVPPRGHGRHDSGRGAAMDDDVLSDVLGLSLPLCRIGRLPLDPCRFS
jgi:hypothetical protein